MSRIQKAFENKKAFIAFLTVGDPSLDKTEEYILEMEWAGADLHSVFRSDRGGTGHSGGGYPGAFRRCDDRRYF